MKEKLTKNLRLKIVAVLFAASLWMISININDPYQSKDYSVTVQLQNMNVMNTAGKYVEVLDNSDKISVRVRGSRSVMDSFSAANIVATADINEMDENNQIPIKFSTIKTSGSKIESIRSNDNYLTVKVEDIQKIQKNIEVVTKNTPAKGYILGKTSTEQNALRISGPESAVNLVSRVVVNFDLDGAKDDVSMILPIELYDEEGRRINDERLTTSIKEVQCVATILETKEVPLVSDVKGDAAKGYGFTGVLRYEPETVLIAGKSSGIRNINQIEITEAMDIQNARENVTSVVDLREFLPDNIVLAAASFNGKVKVTAVIEPEITKKFEVDTKGITIVNVPEGRLASLTEHEDKIEVELTGFESVIQEFDGKELKAEVDILSYMASNSIAELESGSYKMELIFELPEGMWLEEPQTVEIVIE